MPVSFARDILPMFRPIDIEHISKHNILLDDYTYMSDPLVITATHRMSRTGWYNSPCHREALTGALSS